MIFCVLLQWWKSDRHKHDSRFNTDWSHAQWRDAQWRDALSGEVLSEEMLSVKRCSQWRDAQWLKPHPALVQVLSSIPRILIQLVTISCNLGPGRSDSSESMYTDMYNTPCYTDIYIIKRESLKKKKVTPWNIPKYTDSEALRPTCVQIPLHLPSCWGQFLRFQVFHCTPRDPKKLVVRDDLEHKVPCEGIVALSLVFQKLDCISVTLWSWSLLVSFCALTDWSSLLDPYK